MDYGIDTSKFNTVSDWSAVHGNGIGFMSQKITQGSYYVDQSASGHIAGARAAGIAVGGYHFADPNQSIADNTDGFARLAGQLGVLSPGSFLPMLDIEDSPADGIHWTAASANAFIPAWRNRFRQVSGVDKVAIYASLSVWTSILRAQDWADSATYLWIAVYNGDPGNLQGYSNTRAALHQHTDAGNVPGIPGRVDRNVTLGGFSLADLTLGAPVTAPSAGDTAHATLDVDLGGGSLADFVRANDGFTAAPGSLSAKIDALTAKVAALSVATPTVDLDALASKVAAKITTGASLADIKALLNSAHLTTN